MSSQVPKDVAARLDREQVIWLTTTKADGTPLPNPVWFLWNGTEFLVFAMAKSVKMRNMTRNPRVSLNLNSDSHGGDVAIFQVEAQTEGASLTDAERTAYLSKYEEGLKEIGLTPEDLMKTFRPVRLTLTKYRTVETVG